MRRETMLAALTTALLLIACSGGEPTAPAPAEAPAAEGSAPGERQPAAPVGAEGSAAAAPVEAVAAPTLPPERAVTPGVASFPLGPQGGELVAGDIRLSVPAGALGETVTIEIEALADPTALDRDLPPSLGLGVARGGPWNVPLLRAADLSMALNYELEPGLDLELLAYHPAMRSWLVIGEGRVDETGARASFRVRQLGDMVVRATPVRADDADARCDAPELAIHEHWPGPAESQVVGLVPEEDRIPREVAFGLLTDFRLSQVYDLVEFKNEEVTDLPATRRDERAHVDEDYLMDPNAAAAVEVLAGLVRDEWVDPVSGRSAQRLRITESYDALIEHSVQSTHYQGRGIDLTLTPVPVASPQGRRAWYGRLAQLSICAGFDYVLFENEFHVHASVRPTEFGIAVAEGSGGVTGGGLAAWSERGLLAPVAWTPPGDDGVTADGLRRVVVHEGQAWLVNTAGAPPPGSVHRDGTPLDVRYPYPLSDGDVDVERAVVRPHERTREARTRHSLRD